MNGVLSLLLCCAALHAATALPDGPYPNGAIESDGQYFRWPRPAADTTGRDWMARAMASIGNKTLQQLTIPGTHDSGAYELSKDIMQGDIDPLLYDLIELAESLGLPIDEIITPWALAQSVNLFDQFQSGMRYIDFRAGWNGSEWRTFHFEYGHTVQTLLNDIKKFLDQQGQEVLVIEISHLDGSPPDDAKAALVTAIETTLHGYLYDRNNGFLTIEQMVAKGQRCLVSVDDEIVASHPLLWPGTTMYNTYADSDNLTAMIAYNHERVTEFNSQQWPNQLYKLSWTLTPQASTIINSIWPGQPTSLKMLAEIGNPQLATFAKPYAGSGTRMANIVLVDDFQTSDVADIVNWFNN